MLPRKTILSFAALVTSVGLLAAEENPFSDDVATWTLKNQSDITATLDAAEEDGRGAMFVEISGAPEEAPAKVADVRISRSFGDVNADQTHQITFQARAEKPGKIVVFIYPDNDPQKVLFRKDISIDMDWKDYTLSFTPKETTSHCVLGFAGLGRMNNKYFFRSVAE